MGYGAEKQEKGQKIKPYDSKGKNQHKYNRSQTIDGKFNRKHVNQYKRKEPIFNINEDYISNISLTTLYNSTYKVQLPLQF